MGGFTMLAIMNNTTLDVCVQVFVYSCIVISLAYVPRGSIAMPITPVFEELSDWFLFTIS